MDSSALHQASPLCLDLTFPSGATEEKEKKKESSKASGSFCHVSLQTMCLHAHIRPWESRRQRQTHGARTQMYTSKHILTSTHLERKKSPWIIRSVMLSNSDPPTKLEHNYCDTLSKSVRTPVHST